MGYTTDFEGILTFDKPLSTVQRDYINLLAGTRRMMRSVAALKEMYNGEYGLDGDYGMQGEYYVRDDGMSGQTNDNSVVDYNTPPNSQPSLWCHWIITDDCSSLEWDGGEKFSQYIQWLHYLIDHFFSKWGNKLIGEITWQGEDSTDMGKIQVKDNIVTIKKAKIIYE